MYWRARPGRRRWIGRRRRAAPRLGRWAAPRLGWRRAAPRLGRWRAALRLGRRCAAAALGCWTRCAARARCSPRSLAGRSRRWAGGFVPLVLGRRTYGLGRRQRRRTFTAAGLSASGRYDPSSKLGHPFCRLLRRLGSRHRRGCTGRKGPQQLALCRGVSQENDRHRGGGLAQGHHQRRMAVVGEQKDHVRGSGDDRSLRSVGVRDVGEDSPPLESGNERDGSIEVRADDEDDRVHDLAPGSAADQMHPETGRKTARTLPRSGWPGAWTFGRPKPPRDQGIPYWKPRGRAFRGGGRPAAALQTNTEVPVRRHRCAVLHSLHPRLRLDP